MKAAVVDDWAMREALIEVERVLDPFYGQSLEKEEHGTVALTSDGNHVRVCEHGQVSKRCAWCAAECDK